MKKGIHPDYKEVIIGEVEVRDTFKVPKVGMIAGAYVTEGKVTRNAELRLLRDGKIIHEGDISSLKRFKNDVKEVKEGYECGVGIEDYNDLKVGDVMEVYEYEEVKRTL
jgi:translation initiation factor IF-2